MRHEEFDEMLQRILGPERVRKAAEEVKSEMAAEGARQEQQR